MKIAWVLGYLGLIIKGMRDDRIYVLFTISYIYVENVLIESM